MLVAHPFRQTDGRQGLEQREQRTAEQACLLAGDDRHAGGVAKAVRCRERFGRRAPAPLLRLDDVGHGVTIPRVPLRSCNRVAPGLGHGGIAGKELLEAREVVRVVGREPTNPGEAPDVNRRADEGFV